MILVSLNLPVRFLMSHPLQNDRLAKSEFGKNEPSSIGLTGPPVNSNKLGLSQPIILQRIYDLQNKIRCFGGFDELSKTCF